MENKPLTALMCPIHAYKLGEIVHEAYKRKAGDFIDTGLILRRLLEEAGYEIYVKK